MATQEQLPVVGGGALDLTHGAALRAARPLAVDLSVAPGLEPAGAWAWQGPGGDRVDAICVTGPAWTWVAGFEQPVLDAASAVVRREAGLTWLDAGPVTGGPPFEQTYRGEGLAGRHWLGFRGERLVLCTVACRAREEDCASWLAEVRLVGTARSAPEAGPLVDVAIAAAKRPGVALLACGVAFLVVAGMILWRRPRPRA